MHPELQEAIDFHEAIVAEGGKALVGYDTEKALANVVLLSEIPTTYDKNEQRQVNAGNLLLRGVPGVGKTFFGVILAAISDAKFARIQGRADLQPTEVVGFQMINPATGELITEFGPLASAEVILLDEINRIPLKSQSAFLEGLQDRTVTVGKTTYELPAFSFAIATMNPVELGQGTFPLSEAATDRFAIMVNIGYLPPEEEAEAGQLRLQAGAAERADVEGAHHRAARRDHRARCSCTSGSASTSSGWSPRRGRTTPTPTGSRTRRPSWSSTASISARRRARSSAGAGSRRSGRCCMRRRTEVYPEDIQDLAPYILGHRIWLGPHAASHGLTTDDGDRGRHRAGADSHEDAARPRRGRRRSSTCRRSPRSSCSSCKRMREFTLGDHRSLFTGHRLRLRRPARLAAGRPHVVDRLGAVVAHQLQPADRPRVRAATAPPTVVAVADASLSTRCGIDGVPIAAAIARAIAHDRACRRCSSRICSG